MPTISASPFLIDLRKDRVRFASVAQVSQYQKNSGQPFFTGVENLIHHAFLVSTDAGKHVIDEKCRKGLLILDRTQHLFSFNPKYGAICKRPGWRRAPGPYCRYAFLTCEVPRAEQANCAFFALRFYSELHRARQDIEDSITPFALLKEDLFSRDIYNRLVRAGFQEKSLKMKERFFLVSLAQLLLCLPLASIHEATMDLGQLTPLVDLPRGR